MKSKSLILLLPVLILVFIAYQGAVEPMDRSPGDSPAAAVGATSQDGNQNFAPQVDWQQIASQWNAASPAGRIDEDSDYGQLLTGVEAMTGQQLAATWGQLAEVELLPEAKAHFQSLVMGTLLRKDAELALTRFANLLDDFEGPTGNLFLSSGFRDWSMRSPLKAGLWLDARIADGTLGAGVEVNGTPLRVLYERELIRSLLLSGPDKAAARLEAMPDRWRVMALQGTDSIQSRRAYAMLVRKYFPERDWVAEFSRMASAVRYLEGSDAVAKLLETIAATPAERERITEGSSDLNGGQGAAGQR